MTIEITSEGFRSEGIPVCWCETMTVWKEERWVCPRWRVWRPNHLRSSIGGGVTIPPGKTITFAVPIPQAPDVGQN